MAKTKITITIDIGILKKLDALVHRKVFHNRNQAIQEVLEEKLPQMRENRLARECNKLDAKFEKTLAEVGILLESSEWPEY